MTEKKDTYTGKRRGAQWGIGRAVTYKKRQAVLKLYHSVSTKQVWKKVPHFFFLVHEPVSYGVARETQKKNNKRHDRVWRKAEEKLQLLVLFFIPSRKFFFSLHCGCAEYTYVCTTIESVVSSINVAWVFVASLIIIYTHLHNIIFSKKEKRPSY